MRLYIELQETIRDYIYRTSRDYKRLYIELQETIRDYI